MQRNMQAFKQLYPLLFSFIFFIPSTHAREPLPPRFAANADTGVYTVGQADLMLSLDGDSQHNLYVDPQGAYGSDQQWVGDLGLGYRWIKNDAAIVGAYVFAGRTRVANNSSFWITNPGLEVMGSRWDARINAYIPVAGRSNELGIREFNVSTPVFTGHTGVINSVFNSGNAIQQIGNGADARVGYQIFRQVPLKGYVGTYFFAIPNTDNIFGGAAGLDYWFDDNIRLFANYSYDKYQHKKILLFSKTRPLRVA
ncbi:MAG: inverse autotransporter beta domain-containing protein [Pseudomonadota bacterium]